MSSGGQVVGGVLGAIGGFILGGGFLGGGFLGAFRGALVGATLGGVIDPPAGPNLMGPTLEDKSFNSASYGASLSTLFGTIATTGNIFYLENNEYKAVAKKQKTGGKGGAPRGSYTTTTYYATFAVALGEAMPGSVIRRIWAGGQLIYSVGESVDIASVLQSNANAGGWRYYDGSQTEPDSRMEGSLGVGNCPSYEGTAYIIFYDFDLTEYGNGLQGCPIKVEVVAAASENEASIPPQKIFESMVPYPANIYDAARSQWRQNLGFVRGLTLTDANFMARWEPSDYDYVTAQYYSYKVSEDLWDSFTSTPFNTRWNNYQGLTFGYHPNWVEYDPTLGNIANNFPDSYPTGWVTVNGRKITFGDHLISEGIDWHDQMSLAAAYDGGNFYIINGSHIVKLSGSGGVLLQRNVDDWYGYGVNLWYDDGYLYRAEPRGSANAWKAKVWIYDAATLVTLRSFEFGYFPSYNESLGWKFAVYGDTIVVGWSTRNGASGGELHYEQWRFKNFTNVQVSYLSTVVGRIMNAVGVTSAFRDLTELTSDEVRGYRITDASSARGSLGPLQAAYLFDLIDDGYKIKAVKRGGEPIATIPLSDLGARSSGEALGVLVRRERDTDTQLPSRYLLTYIDYNREYDANTQPADYPSSSSNERNQQLPIVLSAGEAAKLADVLINLAWVERYIYSISVPQKYLGLKLGNVIRVEVAEGIYSTMRIASINATADQRLEITGKQAEPSVYQSSAVGIDVPPPSESIPFISTANTVLMNLPAINDETSSYGFGVAMSGGKNWVGGNLLRSIDNGQTYDAIQSFSSNCTIATAENILAAGDYFVIDRTHQLNLKIIAGEFFSITEAQMLSGKHYCAYGKEGRWEIIQYANAAVNSANSVTLSIFVRGLFGTEWAGDLHEVGDTFVFLDDPDTAFIGADAVALNSPRKFKGVSNGQDAQLISELDFAYRGINLKPLSPVNVRGYIDNEIWYIGFDCRSRISGSQWVSGVVAPVGETVLDFEVDVYDGVIFKRTLHGNSNIFLYPPALQLTDFGYLPATLTIKICQISSVVGRGFLAQKTLIGIADLYGDKVVLLLHCNGANGSTAIADSSKSPKTVSVFGNAQLSVARSKFGGASLLVDGVGDYISVSGLLVGADDFTIDAWVYVESPGSAFIIYDNRTADQDNSGFVFYIRSTSKLTFATGNPFVATSGSTNVVANTWHHVSLVRISGSITGYLNGVLEFTVSSSQNFSNTVGKIGHQWNSSGTLSAGNIDDFRLSIKIGRYTASFTPPIQQFPDPI